MYIIFYKVVGNFIWNGAHKQNMLSFGCRRCSTPLNVCVTVSEEVGKAEFNVATPNNLRDRRIGLQRTVIHEQN